MKKNCFMLIGSIAIIGTLTGCARMQIWFGMGESAGVDYTHCKKLEARAKDSSVEMKERERAFKKLSICRKNAEKKFLEKQK